jgi:RNA-binding protein
VGNWVDKFKDGMIHCFQILLKETGVILHLAKSGRLIVSLSKALQTGAVLLDDKGKKLGTVVELIGPVKSPYASVMLATSRIGQKGNPIYTNE